MGAGVISLFFLLWAYMYNKRDLTESLQKKQQLRIKKKQLKIFSCYERKLNSKVVIRKPDRQNSKNVKHKY